MFHWMPEQNFAAALSMFPCLQSERLTLSSASWKIGQPKTGNYPLLLPQQSGRAGPSGMRQCTSHPEKSEEMLLAASVG